MNQKQYENLIIVANNNTPGYLDGYTLNGALPTILAPVGDTTVFSRMLNNIDNVAKNIYIISLSDHYQILKDTLERLRPDLIDVVQIHAGVSGHNISDIFSLIHYSDLSGTTLVVTDNVLTYDMLDLVHFNRLLDPLNVQKYNHPTLEVSVGCSFIHNTNLLFDESGFTEIEKAGNVTGVYAFNDASLLSHFYDSYIGDEFLRNNDVRSFHEIFDFMSDDTKYNGLTALNINIFADTFDVNIFNSDRAVQDYKNQSKKQIGYKNTEVTKNEIIKTADTDKERYHLANEIGYIGTWESLGLEAFTPDVLGMEGKDVTKDMSMLKVENSGISVFEYISGIQDQKERFSASIEIFKKYLRFVKPIHDTYEEDVNIKTFGKSKHNALTNEYITDLKVMYASNKSLFESVKVRRVNNRPVPNFEYLIERLKDFIDCEFSDIDFTVIHGDANTKNVLLSDEGMKFINLNCNFGGVEYVGDPYKDIALFAVDLIGGISLQNMDINSNLIDGDLSINLMSPTIYGLFVRNTEHEQVITAIYWLKQVTKYLDNPLKAIAVFYTGLDMLNHTLTNAEY